MKKDSYMQVYIRLSKQDFIEGVKAIHQQKKFRVRQFLKVSSILERYMELLWLNAKSFDEF